jgi:CBS domain-containing protein
VGDFLTASHKRFSSLNEDRTLLDAMMAIAKHNRPFVIVEDAGHHPAGLITSLDVMKMISMVLADDQVDLASALSIKLREVVSPEVVVVDSNTSMEEAVRIMCSSPHQHLPVTGFIGSAIDDDTRWHGVISAKDLLRWSMDQRGKKF